MYRKRVAYELHDSYFRSMPIKHTIPKTAEVHIPMASYGEILCGRWTIIYLSAQEIQGVWGSDELEIRCGTENQHLERLGPQAPGWAAQEYGNKTLMANRVGVNMLQFCSVSNSLSHTTLSNKVRGIFFKGQCRSSLLRRRYDFACMHMSIQHKYCYVTYPYMNMWNVPRMFITYIHRT